MAKTTDEAVLGLLKKVEQKKAEIKQAQKKPVWLTNLTIGYNPESTADRIMIQTVRDPQKLLDIYAFLLMKEDYVDRASNSLGLAGDGTYMGYSFHEWKLDLKTRADQLGLDQKKKELDALDKRVNSLVSPDQRREMELAALTAELGG